MGTFYMLKCIFSSSEWLKVLWDTLICVSLLEKKSHFVDKILFFTVDQIIKDSDLNKEAIVSSNSTKMRLVLNNSLDFE